MTKLDAIRIAKEFRQDADALLQRMKAHKRSLCEPEAPEIHFVTHWADDKSEAIAQHTLSIRDLESAIMRQGMTLKAIGNPHPSIAPKTLRQLAEEAYARYGSVTDFKNFRGDPMPKFEDLGEKIQSAWEAAVNLPVSSALTKSIYPNSYDPSSPVVDPTADGLKM